MKTDDLTSFAKTHSAIRSIYLTHATYTVNENELYQKFPVCVFCEMSKWHATSQKNNQTNK